MTLATLWDLRGPLTTSTLPGSSVDAFMTPWIYWWVTRVGLLAGLGGWSDLCNFPLGTYGSFLAPSGLLLWELGSALAFSSAAVLLVVGEVVGLSLGCVWLARRVGRPSRPWLWGALATLCTCWFIFENPYLAPVLPAGLWVCALLHGFRGRRRETPIVGVAGLTAALAGSLVLWLLVRHAAPDYPAVEGRQPWIWAGIAFPDLVGFKPTLTDLLLPASRWTETSSPPRWRGPLGLSIGLVPLALTGWILVRRWRHGWPWGLLAGVGILLTATGAFEDTPSLFQVVNLVVSYLFRPLSTSLPFVVIAVVALAVTTALGVDTLRSRSRWAALAACGALIGRSGGLTARARAPGGAGGVPGRGARGGCALLAAPPPARGTGPCSSSSS